MTIEFDKSMSVTENLERLYAWALEHEQKDSDRHRELLNSIIELRDADDELRKATAGQLFDLASKLESLGKTVEETRGYSEFTAKHVEQALNDQAEKDKEQDAKIADNRTLIDKYVKPAFYVSVIGGVLGMAIDKLYPLLEKVIK